jgi:hypothetical protein
MFFVKSERLFLPIISIPINEELGLLIKNKMLKKEIPEEQMTEHSSVKIMDNLGF